VEAGDRFQSPHYHRMLVAFDYSEAAAFALRHAVGRARDDAARLTIVTVVPRMPGIVARTAITPERIAEQIQQEAVDLLRATAESLPQDVSVTTILRHGDPADEIIALLGEQPFDLLCIGARGRGRIAAALLGSVSRSVLHRSPVPVMVFHPPATAPHRTRH
jgi:nucleotide-binding universal stress UspA family protein